MQLQKAEVTQELLRDLLEAATKRACLRDRVAEVMGVAGEKQFEAVAWAVKRLYRNKGSSLEAAGKCLARAWRRAFPDQTMPGMPKRFYARDKFDQSGD